MDLSANVAKVRKLANELHAEALGARVSTAVELDPARLFERTSDAILGLLAIIGN
jgi:hypothetical protein